MDKKTTTVYKPKAFAELLGISVRTLQRWDDVGILKAHRSLTNRRYYTQDQYDEYMKNGAPRETDKK